MKNLNKWMMVACLTISSLGYSQKQKKTYDADVFAGKVKFSFTPEYVTSRSPDAAALIYISQQSGKSLDEVKQQDEANRSRIKENVQAFSKYGLIFNLDETEVKVKQETPLKIGDVVMHCSSGDTKFTIILTNCVQTDISWYLGDGITFEGEIFGEQNMNQDAAQDESPNTQEEQVELSDYEKEVVQAADEAHFAPKIDWFANRPTKVDPSIASAKPEEPVKKESFVDRLNRIKTDGNKVGVLIRCGNIVVNPGNFDEGITKARVIGTYEPLAGLNVLASKVVSEFNTGFGVDVFEVVDYAKVPVTSGNGGLMDDWWSTKYKMIVIYDLKPYYNAYYKTNEKSGEREYKGQMRVDSEVIIMAAEGASAGRLKYVTASPKQWGEFRSDYFTGPASTDFHKIQDLRAAINPPADEKVIEFLIQSQQEHIEKLIEKKSK